jgi:hypothetical protein
MRIGRAYTPNTAAECLAVLGLDASASADEVKKAFRRLVRQFHPDRAGAAEEPKEAFHAVVEAYRRLKEVGLPTDVPGVRLAPTRKIVPPEVKPLESWWRPRKPHRNYAVVTVPLAIVVALLVWLLSYPSLLPSKPSLHEFTYDEREMLRWEALAMSLTFAFFTGSGIFLLGAAAERFHRWQKRYRRSYLD